MLLTQHSLCSGGDHVLAVEDTALLSPASLF